jgi:hypothetical protein
MPAKPQTESPERFPIKDSRIEPLNLIGPYYFSNNRAIIPLLMGEKAGMRVNVSAPPRERRWEPRLVAVRKHRESDLPPSFRSCSADTANSWKGPYKILYGRRY